MLNQQKKKQEEKEKEKEVFILLCFGGRKCENQIYLP